MKKWMCGVCGFSVTAEEPPENCPVCGADKSLFVLVEDTSENSGTSAGQSGQQESGGDSSRSGAGESSDFRTKAYMLAEKIIAEHHLHPISVHVPNGVVPVAFVFVLLFLFFGSPALDMAAFLNLVFVLLAMPVVIFTGYSDWKKKYSGAMTRVFKTKMICAAVLSSTAFITVVWRAFDSSAGSSVIYLLLNAVILVSAGVAGFMGGKLVFKN